MFDMTGASYANMDVAAMRMILVGGCIPCTHEHCMPYTHERQREAVARVWAGSTQQTARGAN